MFEDLNARLGQAHDAAARQEKWQRRVGDLQQERDRAQTELRALEQEVARSEREVRDLEGVSLAGLIHAILGNKEEQLQEARQKELAAELKLDAARKRSAAAESALAQAQSEASRLKGAAENHQQLLREKEELVRQSGGTSAAGLFRLTEAERQAEWRIQQYREAAEAGMTADACLAQVENRLESARGWGTWDMIGGRGGLPDWVKHNRIDEARDAAGQAEAALGAFQRELRDVGIDAHIGGVTVEGFSRFVDIFFDNLLTDWMVQNKIVETLDNARRTRSHVKRLLDEVARGLGQAQAELEQARQERARYVEGLA